MPWFGLLRPQWQEGEEKEEIRPAGIKAKRNDWAR